MNFLNLEKITNYKKAIINSLQTARSAQFEADVELNPDPMGFQ
jgi:hypothetical protein